MTQTLEVLRVTGERWYRVWCKVRWRVRDARSLRRPVLRHRHCWQNKELFKPVSQDILVANKIEEVQAVEGETLNSIFNQTLEYQLSRRELANKMLRVMAWTKKFLGRNQYLREVNVRLAVFEDTAPRFHMPHDCSSPALMTPQDRARGTEHIVC